MGAPGAEILRGIHLIRGRVSNIYLVETTSGALLVDAGTPEDPEGVLGYLRAMGLEVGVIFVTHAHWDHVGGLKRLRDVTGARVAAHREEAPYVRGGGTARRRFEPVDVDVEVENGTDILGLLVIHTPGHTPGSSCLLDGKKRAILVGDLVYEEGGRLYEMHHHYSRDPHMNRKSIARLLEYDFDHVLPSHGNPLLGEGKDALRRVVESFSQ